MDADAGAFARSVEPLQGRLGVAVAEDAAHRVVHRGRTGIGATTGSTPTKVLATSVMSGRRSWILAAPRWRRSSQTALPNGVLAVRPSAPRARTPATGDHAGRAPSPWGAETGRAAEAVVLEVAIAVLVGEDAAFAAAAS